MDPSAPLSFKALISQIVADMAKALCERPNETTDQRSVRIQAVTQMILGLLPRDVIEAMLAGHTVMFHALMTDSIHDTLQGQIDTMRRATRGNIVALNRAFHMNLEKLAQYRRRPSQGAGEGSATTDATAAEAPAQTRDVSAPEPKAETQPTVASVAESDSPLSQLIWHPTAEQIAAVQANPEAMAALEAGDARRFAQAMGVEYPSEESLEAAAVIPSKAPQPLNRQMRRHPR
jgi:hypothetical protein